MVDYSLPLFRNPTPVWDAKTCEKKANRTTTDGLGTKCPFKGYIGSPYSIPPTFGKIRYNGGTVRNGKWYQGEHFPFPKLAKGFKIVVQSTWGWQLVKTTTKAKKS